MLYLFLLLNRTKHFLFNHKKYQFDFELIKNNSNYFFSKRNEYKEIHDIVLLLEPIDISEESIPLFISSLHNDSFEINDSNVFSLHQLSIQYEVSVLNELSSQYINQILQASSSIDHTKITKINQSTNLPTCDYKNTETINYNNEINEINEKREKTQREINYNCLFFFFKNESKTKTKV